MSNKTTAIILTSYIILMGCANLQPGGNQPVIVGEATATIPASLDATRLTEEPTSEIELPTPISLETTLVVCIPEEPTTLNPYMAADIGAKLVLQAIYDGPIDVVSYRLEPVILQKIPNLADGDARITTVAVNEGDLIQLNDGSVAQLEAGMEVRPSGCTESSCAINYTEGELIMDQMVITYKLLRGVLWSDGTSLTAGDSVYAYSLLKDPATPVNKTLIDRTAEYTAKDEITAEWRGTPGFLHKNYEEFFFTPYPQHMWGTLTPAELVNAPITNLQPMGWGPYMIESWTPGTSIVMKKNPFYFRSPEGLPNFEEVIFRFVGHQANTNIASTITGECDLISELPVNDELPINLLKELEGNGQIKAIFAQSAIWEQINFGINPQSYDNGYGDADRPAIFNDVRTRQALAYCLDRAQVSELVMRGYSPVMDTYLPAEHPLFNLNAQTYPFDPASGIAKLEEVGWVLGQADGIRAAEGVLDVPNGTRLSMNYYALETTQNKNIFLLLSGSAAQCGIELTATYFTPDEYYADAPEGVFWGRNFDLAQSTWVTERQPRCDNWVTGTIPGDGGLTVGNVDWLSATMAPDIDLSVPAFPLGWFGWNVTGYSDLDFNAACKNGLGALPGQNAYRNGHQEAQQIFADDLPVIPLFPRLRMTVTRPDMCGFELNPTANALFKIEEIGIGGDCK